MMTMRALLSFLLVVSLACASRTERSADTGAADGDPAAAPGSPLLETIETRHLDQQALPRLEFPLLPPTPGTNQAQQDEWASVLRKTWTKGFGRTTDSYHAASAELDARDLDIVDATPAWFNALRGLDLGDSSDLAFASYVLVDWRSRQGSQLKFPWDPDPAHSESDDLARRCIVVDGILDWWLRVSQSPEDLAAYRQHVAERLMARAEAIREP